MSLPTSELSRTAAAREGLPVEGFVRLPQILAVFPVSRSSWWAGVKSGRFPPPVKLGPRVTAWDAADIRALFERFRSANRDNKGANLGTGT